MPFLTSLLYIVFLLVSLILLNKMTGSVVIKLGKFITCIHVVFIFYFSNFLGESYVS